MPPRNFLHSRLILVAQVALLLLSIPCFARERGPRVEIVCPAVPIPLPIENNRVLVYELHITNFDTVPLALKNVEVFDNDDSNAPLMRLEGDKLAMTMTRIGLDMMAGSGDKTTTIDPGARSVVFLWIELPMDRAVPLSLKHRLTFSPAPSSGGTTGDTTLDNFELPVKKGSLPELSPPFQGGIWLAGDGPTNNSNHRRSIFAIDGHIYSPQRFATDWVKVGPNGDSRHDGATKNENWWGWGEPVLAVADGEITEAVDKFPDNAPRVLPSVTLDNIAGNHITLKIAHDRFVTYAHLQRASIKVRTGSRVHRGEVLALLGNSGNTTGAHLHLQVTDRDSALQSEGVPFVFADFTYLGPGSDYPEKQIAVPRVNSMPPGDGVVRFDSVKK